MAIARELQQRAAGRRPLSRDADAGRRQLTCRCASGWRAPRRPRPICSCRSTPIPIPIPECAAPRSTRCRRRPAIARRRRWRRARTAPMPWSRACAWPTSPTPWPRTLVAMSQRGTVNNSRRLAETIVRTFGQQRRAPAAAHPPPGGLRRADLARHPRRPGRARLPLQSAGREASDRAPAPDCAGAGAPGLGRRPFCGRGCHKKGVTFWQSSALLPLGLAA